MAAVASVHLERANILDTAESTVTALYSPSHSILLPLFSLI